MTWGGLLAWDQLDCSLSFLFLLFFPLSPPLPTDAEVWKERREKEIDPSAPFPVLRGKLRAIGAALFSLGRDSRDRRQVWVFRISFADRLSSLLSFLYPLPSSSVVQMKSERGVRTRVADDQERTKSPPFPFSLP